MRLSLEVHHRPVEPTNTRVRQRHPGNYLTLVISVHSCFFVAHKFTGNLGISNSLGRNKIPVHTMFWADLYFVELPLGLCDLLAVGVCNFDLSGKYPLGQLVR